MAERGREGADLDFDVDVDEPAAARPAPPPAPAEPWPGAVPGAAEALRALERALALADPGAAGAPLAAAAAALTGLERGVLAGAQHPIDTAPIRRAAAMRVRLAVALDAAPAGRARVDVGAVSALLTELDALLSDLATLAEDAPDDVRSALGGVRQALAGGARALSAAALRAGSGAGSD